MKMDSKVERYWDMRAQTWKHTLDTSIFATTEADTQIFKEFAAKDERGLLRDTLVLGATRTLCEIPSLHTASIDISSGMLEKNIDPSKGILAFHDTWENSHLHCRDIVNVLGCGSFNCLTLAQYGPVLESLCKTGATHLIIRYYTQEKMAEHQAKLTTPAVADEVDIADGVKYSFLREEDFIRRMQNGNFSLTESTIPHGGYFPIFHFTRSL